MAKPAPDWEVVEREYRAGVFSVREIGKRHSLPESSVRLHAKQSGWQRDLSQRVQEEVRAKLARTTEGSEAEIVEAAAETVVQVVKVHREDIGRCRSLVELLFGQLNEAALHRNEIENSIIEATIEDSTKERRNRMLRAVALPAHAATMRDLSQALRNAVVLERQAFNLDDQPTEAPEPRDQLSAKIAGKIMADLNALATG
jgi:hypothetical protein